MRSTSKRDKRKVNMASIQPRSPTYRAIQSLRPEEKGVDVMGVVTAFSPPVKTKGSDYYCRVRLADKTSPSITCLLFSPNPDRLPQESQCAVGDVVCLQGMNIVAFQERVQGILRLKSQGMWVAFSRPRQLPSQSREGGKGREQRRLKVAVPLGRIFHPQAEEERMVAELLDWVESSNELWQREGQEGGSGVMGRGRPAPTNSLPKLRDLKLGMDADTTICGVVLHLKPPTKTKRGGYFTSIVLTDETAPPDGFTVVLFGVGEEELPTVYGKGDVVLLRGMKIERFQGVLKAQGRERAYTAIVFSGHPRAGMEPRDSAGKTSFSPSPREKQRVEELRSWSLEQPGLRMAERNQYLKDVAMGANLDLTCQVVATAFNATRRQAILTVWDGTETSVPCSKKDKLDASYAVRTSQDLAEAAGHLACEVVLYAVDTLQAQPGDVVRLIHVTAVPSLVGPSGSDPPTVQLYIAKDSYIGGGVIVLVADDAELQDLKRRLPATADVRVPEFRKLKRPLPTSVTTVLEPNAKQRATVCAIRGCPDVPKRFLTQVRVRQVSPSCIEDLCELRCPACYKRFQRKSLGAPCPRCTRNKPDEAPPRLKYVYNFLLQVEDPSGHLNVFVSSTDAETLFPELPPADLASDREGQAALLSRLYYLTGGNDPFLESPGEAAWPRPWMECGIMSYRRSSDEVFYRIFDTVLNEWDL